MKIIHENSKSKYNLEIDYDYLLGDWSKYLKNYLNSIYQSNLMFFLYEFYKYNLNQNVINKKDLFKNYKLCPYDKVKVVILDLTPNITKNSNGLLCGNKYNLDDKYDENLKLLFDKIETEQDGGFKVDKDYTLESWAKQGVLMLNFPPIKVTEIEKIKFYNLISNTIEAVNHKSGIIFCFINNKNGYFKNKISIVTNTILNSDSLSYNLLKQINNELESKNGKECIIKW